MFAPCSPKTHVLIVLELLSTTQPYTIYYVTYSSFKNRIHENTKIKQKHANEMKIRQ